MEGHHKTLAKLVREIWWLDDAGEYPQLRNVARKLFSLEGFGNASKSASNALERAYYYAEMAKRNRQNAKKHEYFLEKSEAYHTKVSRIIGEDSRAGKLHMLWWRLFIHKVYAPIPLVLFLEHIVKGLGVLASLKCTIYLTLAGYMGHDARSKDITDRYLEKYWRVIERSGKRIAMF